MYVRMVCTECEHTMNICTKLNQTICFAYCNQLDNSQIEYAVHDSDRSLCRNCLVSAFACVFCVLGFSVLCLVRCGGGK